MSVIGTLLSTVEYIAVVLEACIVLASILFGLIILLLSNLPKTVKRIALLLFLNIAFIAVFYLLLNVQWNRAAESLYWIFAPGTLTLGLLFFRFTSSYLKNKSNWLDYLILYLPLVVFLFVGVFEILNSIWPSSETIGLIRVYMGLYLLLLVFPVYNIIGTVRTFTLVRKTERINREAYASELTNNLRWSKWSIAIYLVFLLGLFASVAFADYYSDIVFNVSLLFLTLYIGYFEIRKISAYMSVIQKTTEEKPKIALQVDQESDKLALYSEVDNLIEDRELFLDVDLSISQIAKIVKVNSKYVSQAINAHAGTNFNGYINAKRIRHAEKMLRDGALKKLSIEGIANASGFRSKSTFNSYFKKAYNCTPSQFMERLSSG